MSERVYELRQVRQQYGANLALNLPEFAISDPGIFCLLGPTGAGKSTLLRLLAGVEAPTSGEVVYRGTRFHLPTLPLATRRSIAMVFQQPAVLRGTVQANVEYGLRCRGERSASKKVCRSLERFGIAGLANRSAQHLSVGQRQLLALARACILEPEVLLLDEPTASLDPAHVALVEQAIADICRERSATVVWSTHNLFQARRMADRAALLLEGTVVETARANEFFTQPQDARTRDFVEGKMIY